MPGKPPPQDTKQAEANARSRSVRAFFESILFVALLGYFGFIILFFIGVSLMYPSLASLPSVDLVFWPALLATVFAVEVWIADATTSRMTQTALRSGLISTVCVIVLLVVSSPLLFTDPSIQGNMLAVGLLIAAPALGIITGSWFAGHRQAKGEM